MMFFAFAALIITNELMFGEGNEEYKWVHHYWVRPWIGRRDKGRRQNSKDVVTNLPLKLATSGN